jgi:hypothetical protein
MDLQSPHDTNHWTQLLIAYVGGQNPSHCGLFSFSLLLLVPEQDRVGPKVYIETSGLGRLRLMNLLPWARSAPEGHCKKEGIGKFWANWIEAAGLCCTVVRFDGLLHVSKWRSLGLLELHACKFVLPGWTLLDCKRRKATRLARSLCAQRD